MHHIVTGGRGTGKTVLLAHLERHVSAEWRWPIVRWSGGAGGGLRELFNEVGPVVERQLTSRVGRVLRPDTISASVPGVGSVSKQVGATSQLWSPQRWLEHLGALAADKGRGVLVAVDEIQDVAPADLSMLAQALQIATKRAGFPIGLVAAGLPHTRRVLRNVPGSPFLERQPAHEIGNLDLAATRDALELPIVEAGRQIEAEALRRIVAASGGYPYAIQVIGAAVWLADVTADVITVEHARLAEQRLSATLVDQLYESRWEDLPPVLQDYVRAAAALIGPQGASTAGIAASLGRTTSDLSTARDELINRHHLLHAIRTGYVAFTVPGFDGWVRSLDIDRETGVSAPAVGSSSAAETILQEWTERGTDPGQGVELEP